MSHLMRRLVALVVLVVAQNVCAAADLSVITPNSWEPIKPQIVQPADADEQGQWVNAGWNKLVYDPDGKRVLFNDRWHDKKHGGTTIYGNCIFSFDPASAKLTPLKIVNWTKKEVQGGGYRTPPLPENDKE